MICFRHLTCVQAGNTELKRLQEENNQLRTQAHTTESQQHIACDDEREENQRPQILVQNDTQVENRESKQQKTKVTKLKQSLGHGEKNTKVTRTVLQDPNPPGACDIDQWSPKLTAILKKHPPASYHAVVNKLHYMSDSVAKKDRNEVCVLPLPWTARDPLGSWTGKFAGLKYTGIHVFAKEHLLASTPALEHVPPKQRKVD